MVLLLLSRDLEFEDHIGEFIGKFVEKASQFNITGD